MEGTNAGVAPDREREAGVGWPAKLAARARGSGTGQGGETDATDAHVVVMVALREKGLRKVRTDPGWMCCGCCGRRDELSARAQTLNSRWAGIPVGV